MCVYINTEYWPEHSLKQDLQKINWEELNTLNCTNTPYKYFIKNYSRIYDKNFPLLETEVQLNSMDVDERIFKTKAKTLKFLNSKNPEDELTKITKPKN